jgi:hypothetical protein
VRIGIQGWGSEGDLRPLIALAGRLRAAGHSPRLVLTPVDGKDYGPLCASLDVPLVMVPERMAITVQELLRDAKSSNPTKLMTAVLDLTFFLPRRDGRGCAGLSRGGDAHGEGHVDGGTGLAIKLLMELASSSAIPPP